MGSSSYINIKSAIEFQSNILKKVSRSFGLTIPQLPKDIRLAVENCYLWCRITDTIEDEINLSIEEKLKFHQQIISILNDKLDIECFIKNLLPSLSQVTTIDEKTLIINANLILTVTKNLPLNQVIIIKKCVVRMNELMPKFEKISGLNGLKNLIELNKYCYAVAGVVGEMLTALFCEYLHLNKQNKLQLQILAIDFAKGLQITNILKDRWEDYRRKICWLPKELFGKLNFEYLLKDPNNIIFITGIKKLININFNNLKKALNYVLLIPKQEIGIRKFCLWSILLAVSTLNNINNNPNFTSTKQIKVSKFKLRLIILITNSIVKSNWLLKICFNFFSNSLKLRTRLCL